MFTAVEVATKICLEYEDRKKFIYSNIVKTASNEDLYKLAMAFNGIQEDVAVKTKIIKEYSLIDM